jgi:arylsulfatase A-like enzyme
VRPGETPGASAGEPPAPVSARAGREVWRALLDESSRAELSIGGAFIDFGTADQHKYTRGGWRSGWDKNEAEPSGITLASVNGKTARFEIAMRDPAPREMIARIRSEIGGQRVTLYAGDKALASADVGEAWTDVRAAIPDAIASAKPRDMMLRFTRSGGNAATAEVDWIWLRSEDNAAPAIPIPRVLPVRVGDTPRRALPAPTSRTYSFYLHVPPDASLVFDYGADEAVTFSVRASTNDAADQPLFSAPAERNQWTEAEVDLSQLAGRAVRLDFQTTGPPGAAGWGEPEILVSPRKRPKLAAGAPKPPRNVLFLLIDTARADAFEPFNANPPIPTPAFTALAGGATVFERAYNNENWTKPSVATLLSGMYPATHDTKRDPSVLPDEVELLSERLKRAGFATGGFVANGFVSDKFGFEQGWDSFRNYIRESRSSEAEHVFGDALAWLDERGDEPFFLYIQTIDPHVTYKVDRRFTKPLYHGEYAGPLGPTVSGHEQVAVTKGELRATKDDFEWLRALYYGEIAYHDEQLGKFVAELESRGLFDDTLVVVTNDHGEELHEHGRLGHGHSLYEELLRAPLMFRYPPLFPAGGRVADIVEHVDVAPTIIDALGLEPLTHADGVTLLPVVHGDAGVRPSYAVSEFLDGKRSIRVGRWKLMRSSSDWVQLFDLETDPGENTDRTADAPIARRLCDVYLGEALAAPDKSQRRQNVTSRRTFEAGQANIDAKLRSQLEALGYFGE